MKKSNGFTLIELLIVVAIIGILASVILPRLRNATDQGEEARIIAEIEGFHKNGMSEEIVAGTFDVVCGMNGSATATALVGLSESIRTNSDQFRCYSESDAFAASAQLNPTEHWCVDSTGNKGPAPNPLPLNQTTCP